MSDKTWQGHAPRECDGELGCESLCRYPGLCHEGGCGMALDLHAEVCTDLPYFKTVDCDCAGRCFPECSGVKEELVAPARPLAEPTETLALMAEYRLTVRPSMGGGWYVSARDAENEHDWRDGVGFTIADAVASCVARIRGQQ